MGFVVLRPDKSFEILEIDFKGTVLSKGVLGLIDSFSKGLCRQRPCFSIKGLDGRGLGFIDRHGSF
jgi:hypothetical protein